MKRCGLYIRVSTEQQAKIEEKWGRFEIEEWGNGRAHRLRH